MAATAGLHEKLLVFVLGAPGAGKGTQCELIKKEFGWSHISAGDLLRAQVAAGTPAGKKAEEYLKAGTMVPASMIIGLLKEAMCEAQHTKVLIDGFPRVADQLREFEREVRPCDLALFFNVAEEAARARLLKRGETSGRCDDNAETIRKRFEVFTDESMPVVYELRADGRVAEIDASPPPEEVFVATRKVIEALEAKQAERAAAAAAAAAGAAAAEPAAAAAAPEVAAAAAAAPVEQPGLAAVAAADVPASAVAGADVAAAAVAPSLGPEGASSEQQLGVPAAAVAAAAAAAVAVPATLAAAGAAEAAVSPVPAPAPAAEPAAAPVAAGSLTSVQMDLSGIRTPIVLCGPSGVGKGTLIAKLMAQHPEHFGFSVSHTTRAPRPGEAHGTHYYFTDASAMAPQVAAGMFLEHAIVHGNLYGTSLAAVARVSAEGKHCVLDIDVQGASQVKRSALGAQCLFIFIAPPSHEELERRLRNRGTETEDKVQQRLANAQSEIAKAQEPGLFHHTLVNADLEAAYGQLKALIQQRIPGLLLEGAGSTRTSEAGGAPAPAAAAAAVGTGAVLAGVAGAAAGPQLLANGSAAPGAALPGAGATATVSLGGGGSTSTLLDFGFGAAGPAVAAKGMPVRQYMDATVIPVLRDGLKALNVARPDDPLQFLADFLVSRKAAPC